MKKQLKLPFILILSPPLLFGLISLLMNFIYGTFHPPAVFDELASDASIGTQLAYQTNSILFYILVMVIPFVAPISILYGVVLLITRSVFWSQHAKN